MLNEISGTVEELIAVLQKMPPKAKVGTVWDGHIRSVARFIWLSRSGMVALADYYDVVYGEDERPEGAPTRDEDPYWRTPDNEIDDH